MDFPLSLSELLVVFVVAAALIKPDEWPGMLRRVRGWIRDAQRFKAGVQREMEHVIAPTRQILGDDGQWYEAFEVGESSEFRVRSSEVDASVKAPTDVSHPLHSELRTLNSPTSAPPADRSDAAPPPRPSPHSGSAPIPPEGDRTPQEIPGTTQNPGAR
jgi:hypothetical protein